MSRMGGRKAFDLEWVERWARQVNEDRRLPVIGRFFSGSFVLGIDDTDYLIEVNKGKVQKIAEGLAPNDFGFEFALRASSVTWGKFAQQIPPPMFNDIWANRRQCNDILAKSESSYAHALAHAQGIRRVP